MTRAAAVSAAVLACAAGASAIASASGRTAASTAGRAAKVQVSRTSIGDILTTSQGLTVYEFTRDRAGKDSCVKVSGCIQIWPALLTSGKPVAGSGVKSSLLSTTRLPDGASQVTYAGHPLYLYAGDSRPRDTGYVGVSSFGGTWEAVSAAGQGVKASKSSAASGAAPGAW
jgi:predicted lipoprotein with Yx(FWY)xxD motif